ncbi:phage tail spike protein [Oceanobacillus oncorhynchi]|uniref:phage tail spike protein n=1 Tax=Oceanobacillus oncorhynchi TaxID=545501 RepID=UPI002F96D52F
MEVFIFSQDELPLTVITAETGLIEAPYRIEINNVPTEPFSFVVNAQHSTSKHVKEENKVVFKDHEGDYRLFVIKRLKDSSDISGSKTRAVCLPVYYAELNDHVIEERRFIDRTVDVALEAAAQGTRWQAVVEVELGRATTNFYRIFSTEALEDIINTWGGEIKDVVAFDERTNRITGCYLKLIQRHGKEHGQRLEIGHNVVEIEREVLSYPKTALYGFGSSLEVEDDEGNHTGGYTRYIDFADVEWKVSNGAPVDKPLGQKWVGDPEALKIYGYEGGRKHREGIFSNQDYEDPEDLLHATWEALQKANKPEVNYRLSVNLFNEKVSLGDTCQAIDRKFARPIEIQARVIAMEYDLMDIEGTMVVEMGQFLDLGDDRIDNIEREIEDIKNRPPKQIIDEGSYPNLKPSTPVNLEAYGGMEVIQLYWQYANEMFIKHYEVYGSRTEDFVPDTQHLLWRGDVSAFSHTVGTDEVWYYRVRAVNYHGRPSDWSVQIRAATNRVLTEDIMWGSELAERMRELHRVSDIIGENGVDFDQISEEAKDLINQRARIYTDEEIDLARDGILSDLDDRTDYLNNRIADLNDRADGLVSRADEIDDLLGEHGDRFINVETDINDIEGHISASIEEIERIDGTVTSNSLELEAQADLIKGKLDEITYTRDKEGILESIEQNTLEIEATAEGLQLNADAISKVDGVVEGHSAQLTFLNDEISTKVEESFVRDAIEDIEIGDRNYYLNTSDNHLVLNSPNEFGTARISGIAVSDDFLETAKGNQVTISIMAKSSGYEQGSSPWIGIETTYQVDGVTRYLTFQMRLVIDDNNEWKRYSNTISIPSNAEDLRKSVTYLIRDIKGQVELKEPTLVIGNKAGSYQLAPEDILSTQEHHWTEINQNSRLIDLQAESITKIGDDISSAQASIEVMSEQITNRVTKTIFDEESDYLRRSIAETRNFAEGIEQTVSSIEIGGRNILGNSKKPRLRTNNSTTHPINISEYDDYVRYGPQNGVGLSTYSILNDSTNPIYNKDWLGKDMVVSMAVKVSKDVKLRFAFSDWGASPRTIKTEYFDVKASEGWVTLKMPVPKDIISKNPDDDIIRFFLYTADNGNSTITPYNGYIDVKDWFIGFGTKVPDWSPAPEDTDQRMTLAESNITQLDRKIDLKVDVDGIVAEINLMKEGIRLKGNLIHLNGLSLIDEAIIKNAHIADGTIERAKLGRAIITDAHIDYIFGSSITAGTITSDRLSVGTLSAVTANMGLLTAGIMQSRNDNMYLNLNTGTLRMSNADFTLGGGGRIRFSDVGNRIYHNLNNRTVGVGLGRSLNDQYPYTFLGSVTGNSLTARDDNYFSGFIVNTYARTLADGIGNSVVGNVFHIRDKSVNFSKGYRFDLSGNTIQMHPMNGGRYNYYIGTNNGSINRIYMNGEIQNNGTSLEIRSDSQITRGWIIETSYTGGHGRMRLRGKYAGTLFYYDLGDSSNRFSNLYLRYQPNVSSDENLKENIKDNKLGLDFINGIETKSFNLINNNPRLEKDPTQYGVSAQQLRDNLINHGVEIDDVSIVSLGEDGMYGVQYNQLIAPTIKAVQELDFKLEEEINWQRIEYQALKNKVKRLEEANAEMEERIEKLEESAA